MKITKEQLEQIVKEELDNLIAETKVSEGVTFHLENQIPISENIYRRGTDKYFELFQEFRKLSSSGNYSLNEEERHLIEDTEIGKFAMFEDEQVPLDFPMLNEEEVVDEDKKDPPIGKPMKNSGGGKKYKVYVRGKSGRVKKITYGDSKGGLKGNWNNAEARKSFAARHKCAKKKDRTKAGYWACRAHKDFGTNVPGRFW